MRCEISCLCTPSTSFGHLPHNKIPLEEREQLQTRQSASSVRQERKLALGRLGKVGRRYPKTERYSARDHSWQPVTIEGCSPWRLPATSVNKWKSLFRMLLQPA